MASTRNEPGGKLYLVSLPIGHRSDITLRAIKTLRDVDFIVAEDTRTTRPLLEYYQIRTPLHSSLYRGVEGRREAGILKLLEEGSDVALVSDAGTPLVSDPGFSLVHDAISSGFTVIPVPGPSAVLAAITGSGLPAERFCFEGMLTGRKAERQGFMERIRDEPRSIIVYESCHRILATLEALCAAFPDRRIVVARELTKCHEEFLRGTASEVYAALAARGRPRGEFVLVIAGVSVASKPVDLDAAAQLVEMLKKENVSSQSMVRALTLALNMPRNEAYAFVQRISSAD